MYRAIVSFFIDLFGKENESRFTRNKINATELRQIMEIKMKYCKKKK